VQERKRLSTAVLPILRETRRNELIGLAKALLDELSIWGPAASRVPPCLFHDGYGRATRVDGEHVFHRRYESTIGITY
jgi:hypothetical protein